MAIDLLGNEPPKRVKQPVQIKMHQPEKDNVNRAKQPTPAKIEPPKAKVSPIKQETADINLIPSFRSYLLKKRVEIILALIIIILILGALALYWATRPVKQPVPVINENLNLIIPQQNIPLEINENENANMANENVNVPVEPPLPPTPPLVLPDTELAPLRGALVNFAGSEEVYLVELNGELRPVDTQSAVWKNGQAVWQLRDKLVYTINDRFKEIRQGKEVKLQIDWDPRVLAPSELQLFK